MSHQKVSSCFVSKLQHYLDISEAEQRSLAAFEKNERSIHPDADVYREGDAATELYVVKSGWLCSYRFTESGQRQIVQLRHPGDLCGMHEMMLNLRSASMMALVPSVVCPLPKAAISELFDSAPRMAMLIQGLAALDHVLMVDTLQAIARTSAIDRMLHLLLHLYYRLKLNNPTMKSEFRLPMTQGVIGDMMGLTNVSVSKSLSELERLGHIRRTRGMVDLLQVDRSIERIGYQNRFDDVDLSWLH